MDRARDRGGEVAAAPRVEQRSHVRLPEPAQADPLVPARAPERGQDLGERVALLDLDVAVRGDEEDASVLDLAREELEQQQRRLVRPVEVVEDQHQRL